MVLQGDSRETLDRLKKEEIDIGIIGALFEDKNIEFKRLGQDKIVLAVKGDHRWAREKMISRKEMMTEKFIIREFGSGTDKTVHEALAKAGIDPTQMKVRANLGSNEAVKQAVSHGMGAAFLSEISIEKELARGDMAVVKIRGLTISRCFYLITRRNRDLSPSAQSFVKFIMERDEGDKPKRSKN